MQWSTSDVQKWISHKLAGNSSHGAAKVVNPTVNQFWNLNGYTLCSLPEDEFKRRDPMNGDKLFAHLDLWKTMQTKSCYSLTLLDDQAGNLVPQQTNSKAVLQTTNEPSSKPHHLPQPCMGEQQVFDLEQFLLSPESEIAVSSPSSPLCSQEPKSLPLVDASHIKIEAPLSVEEFSPKSSSFPSPQTHESVMHTDEGM